MLWGPGEKETLKLLSFVQLSWALHEAADVPRLWSDIALRCLPLSLLGVSLW